MQISLFTEAPGDNRALADLKHCLRGFSGKLWASAIGLQPRYPRRQLEQRRGELSPCFADARRDRSAPRRRGPGLRPFDA
jgi:hypothetical protein